ncbi:MAG: toll/interleukin-1 receptor domain-containing protein [Pseudonocardiaceae bacterium]
MTHDIRMLSRGGVVAKVFLSHASGEVALTDEVHRWLIEEGHEVFQHQHPRDGILTGEDWEQRLHERLHWADAVVCLVTSAYLTSMWCTAEVGAARSRGTRLLPLCAGPRLIHPLLTSTQSATASPV